jgi:hypothetical protein
MGDLSRQHNSSMSPHHLHQLASGHYQGLSLVCEISGYRDLELPGASVPKTVETWGPDPGRLLATWRDEHVWSLQSVSGGSL